jgi:hypothetical protein
MPNHSINLRKSAHHPPRNIIMFKEKFFKFQDKFVCKSNIDGSDKRFDKD